ncbi:MAG: GtrA family protein [Paludibacteraceae bacterium]|nr:GtrA family protein [Paludibacteraceae bacterium]
MKEKLFDPTMIRFIIVGVINTIVGTGTMFLAYNWLGFSYWESSAANYVIGSIVSFFLNKFFTFKNKERSWKQVFKFVLTIVICYLIAYGVAKPISVFVLSLFVNEEQNTNLGYEKIVMIENVAMCIGMFLFVVLNYLTQRFFVFKKNE